MIKKDSPGVRYTIITKPYSPLPRLPIIPGPNPVTAIGTVKRVRMRRARGRLVIVDAMLYDGRSALEAVWFNQPFRKNQLSEGAEVALSGKVERFRGK